MSDNVKLSEDFNTSTPVAPVPAAASTTTQATTDSTAPAPSAALDSLADSNNTLLAQAQESAAPYLKSAQDLAAPYLEKVQAVAGNVVQKAGETYEMAKARADAEIAKQRGAAADATNQTAKAADEFAVKAGQKTDAAAKEGGANLEAAQGYLAGLAQNVTNTISNLSHQLDDRTATSSHPGVVTQASSLLSSATSFVQSHLPASAGEAAVKTEATGVAIAEAAKDKADEAEIQDALRELAQGGKAALGEAKGTVVSDVKHP